MRGVLSAALAAALLAGRPAAAAIYENLGATETEGYACGRIVDGRREVCYSSRVPEVRCSNRVTREELSATKNGECADLRRVDLYRMDLSGANLLGAVLYGKSLAGADLTRAHLEGALLHEARLTFAVMYGAQLHHAQLGFAHLQDALLGGAYLYNANLQNAILTGACLAHALLRSTDFNGAYLNEADLRGAILETPMLWGANLRGAKFDRRTILPATFGDDPASRRKEAERRGMVFIEDGSAADDECDREGLKHRRLSGF
ncbi:MAG: pentapeptide repeat-containing protein [Elusimicrobia bacterium]|nr:pentapeptide repeat-containing protein [Elusimicrobiota bacterium]